MKTIELKRAYLFQHRHYSVTVRADSVRIAHDLFDLMPCRKLFPRYAVCALVQ